MNSNLSPMLNSAATETPSSAERLSSSYRKAADDCVPSGGCLPGGASRGVACILRAAARNRVIFGGVRRWVDVRVAVGIVGLGLLRCGGHVHSFESFVVSGSRERGTARVVRRDMGVVRLPGRRWRRG